MPVYAKTLSPEWRKAFEEFEEISGFEMMYQDDADSGEMTPREAWNDNLGWLQDVATATSNIETPFDEDE